MKLLTRRALLALPLFFSLGFAGCGGGSNGPKPAPTATPTSGPTPRPTLAPAPSASELTGNIVYAQDVIFHESVQRSDIYLARANGTGRTRISPDNASFSYRSPVLSPDGARVAFVATNGPIGLYLVRSDGSDVRRLTTGESYNPVWKPDGKTLIYADNNITTGRSEPVNFFEVNADGSGSPRPFASVSSARLRPGFAFSPDGKTMAYVAADSSSVTQIYVASTDGSGTPRALTSGQYPKSGPAFSPDGGRIAFLTRYERISTNGITVASSDSSGETGFSSAGFVSTGGGTVSRVSFSPDGRFLCYDLGAESGRPTRDPEVRVYVARADGTSEYRLFTNDGLTGSQLDPSWGR